MAASADAVGALLRGAGLDDVQVLSAVPAVAARPRSSRAGPAPEGAPTVLLYAHHDVQPPGTTPTGTARPFEPTERGGRLYGRGAADDKAGRRSRTWAPCARSATSSAAVGVTVFVEGEEEIGSPTFTRVPARPTATCSRADVIVVADSSNWAVGVPGLTTSLRGLVDCVVEVRGAGARRALGHVRRRGPRRRRPCWRA